MLYSMSITLMVIGLTFARPIALACESNMWEKFHELHFHDINSGSVAGLPLHLVFPGGTGCYKGERTTTTDTSAAQGEVDLSKVPAWMQPENFKAFRDSNGKTLPPAAGSAPKIPSPAGPAAYPAYSQPAPYMQPGSPAREYPNAPGPGNPAGNAVAPGGFHFQLMPNDLNAAKDWNSPQIQAFRPGMPVPNGWHLELVGIMPEGSRTS